MGLSGTIAPCQMCNSALIPTTEICRETCCHSNNGLERRVTLNRFKTSVSRFTALTFFSLAIGLISPQNLVQGGEQETSASKGAVGEVEGLLGQARQAMAAGDLQRADSLLQRAEAAKVNYPVLHFGDTPARVRRDLEKLLAAGGQAKKGSAAASGKPQTIVNNFASESGSSKDPFLGSRYQTTGAPTGNVANVNVPQMQSSKTPQTEAAAHLLAARRALVVGDAEQAQQFLQ